MTAPTNEHARFKVVRFYFDDAHPEHRRVIKRRLTLSEAQAWCKDPATEGRDHNGELEWFDGYQSEQ